MLVDMLFPYNLRYKIYIYDPISFHIYMHCPKRGRKSEIRITNPLVHRFNWSGKLRISIIYVFLSPRIFAIYFKIRKFDLCGLFGRLTVSMKILGRERLSALA